MVFTTRFKSKIPHQFSYPIGAELISLALSDVPQAENFEISFYSPYRRMGDRSGPYEILTVSYDPSRIFGSDWRISVAPVSRNLKHVVRETLQADFFPRIRQWLIARADLNGGNLGDSCGVVFDEKHEPMWQWRQGSPRPQRSRR